MTFKNTFHTFILHFPVYSVPFKLQTVLTEELELTSHNKSNSSTSSITTCTCSRHNAAPIQLLSCFCHLSTETNTMLLPPRHLFVSVWRSPAHFMKTTLRVCSYSQLSITTVLLTSGWNIQYDITQNLVSSSPPP